MRLINVHSRVRSRPNLRLIRGFGGAEAAAVAPRGVAPSGAALALLNRPEHLVIRRFASRPDGMFGALLISRGDHENLLPFCLTLEDPWLKNAEGVSCIPGGMYVCERVQSPAFGNTFTVINVPGRSLIRWHWGNTHRDTRGCILLAQSFDTIWDDSTALINSKVTFNRWLEVMDGVTRFTLSIEDVWGGSTRLESYTH